MTSGTSDQSTTRRRERHTATPRNKRLYITYTDTELEVVRLAARHEGQAAAAWAGQKLMAVAQGTLIPVSRDAGDVLRELIRSRLHLQEAVSALHALTTPPAPFPLPPPGRPRPARPARR
ncbi:hypothetical protein [Streptomyces sp. NRRL F-3218]|uniref:hypothetical protein n=1 Tax=Streptomyces sp. NRRL F-3218 TaxID=1463847 RepID=UPI000B1FA076|nr:hypothetical protein [Streptomyces sp. NRRL F-3218]